MNYDSYLARAIEIFNDKMDADFSRDNVILTCFMTDDQEEIFEQFCAQYFPYRLHDRYQEEGYFDFRASSFIGMDNGGKDGILLRTDIDVYKRQEAHSRRERNRPHTCPAPSQHPHSGSHSSDSPCKCPPLR